MAYVAEKDLACWAEIREFPIIPCTLCGSQENLQRKQVGNMLRDWEKKFPGRLENMASALQNVVPSHLLDRKLHPFQTLRATGVADADGDKAFDDEPLPEPIVPQRARVDDGDGGAGADQPRPAGNEAARRAVIPIAVS